jgi:hypothetical protein
MVSILLITRSKVLLEMLTTVQAVKNYLYGKRKNVKNFGEKFDLAT